jgi:uncharacterized protein with NRDE domain
MCLVLFAYDPESQRPLVVAANRDEFYARPAKSAHHWQDAPEMLAGKDLSAGGTWLGVTTSGRFATVTNFAEDGPNELAEKSRGELVERFLRTDSSAHDFAHRISGPEYRGFNLLLFDGGNLVYTSNRGTTRDLSPGVYGLANAELGATWPKVVAGTNALSGLVASDGGSQALIDLLRDDQQPRDELLPKRGRPIDLERRVAPCFIRGEEYGTRASTAVIFRRAGDRGMAIEFTEQQYLPGGVASNRTEVLLKVVQ